MQACTTGIRATRSFIAPSERASSRSASSLTQVFVRGRRMDACYFCARTALEWGSYVSLCQEWRSRTESQQLAVAQLAAIDAARCDAALHGPRNI